MTGYVVVLGMLLLSQTDGGTPEVSPEMVRQLMEQAASGDAKVKRSAIDALGDLGPAASAAIPMLEAMPGNSSYVLEARRKIGPGPEPFPHSIKKEVLPGERTGCTTLRYSLHIDETEQNVFLGTMNACSRSEGARGDWSEGLDQGTLLLRWLEPNRLLHAHWITIPQGSGRHQAQGNLILLKTDGEWRDVFRDWSSNYARGGGADFGGTTMSFQWDADRAALSLRALRYQSEGDSTESGPLMTSGVGEDGITRYFRYYSIEKTWEARLVDGALVFESGVQYFGAGAGFTVGEAVAFFGVRSDTITPDRSAAEHLKFIAEHNAGLTAESALPERMVVADPIPSFEAYPGEIHNTSL